MSSGSLRIQLILCADDAVLSYEDAGQLQILFLEGTVASERTSLLHSIIEESRMAAPIQASGNDMPFVKCILQWLKETKLILNKLPLLGDSTEFLHQEMIRLVEFVGKEGLVLLQEEFVGLMNHDLVPENRPQQTLDMQTRRNAQAQIVATVLENFNLDPYTPESMNDVCGWLERWQAEAVVINGHMICCILEKLIVCDKDRKLENRLLNLLWNQASKLPGSEFVGSLRRIAGHYTSNVTEPSISIHPGEETESFLQACSSADEESDVSRNMGIKFEEKTVYKQRAQIYQDKEVNFNFRTSLQLRDLLGIDIPLNSHESSKECLKRLGQAQHLVSGLKTTSHKHMETVMTSAVAAELRALEAIKKEISLRSELRQSMQEANERHLREYDAMKQDQYKTLEKFLQDCLQEKKEIVKNALYAKAKVIAAVESANLNAKPELSSDDILTRVLQKAEYTLEEVEDKHKKSLEKVPNSECNVCFVNFSLKRKRACFDPCGHTGTCIDCGTQEWRRTMRCPLCQSNTAKPIAVPTMLFFG